MCQHTPKFFHAAPKLAVANCTKCGKPWKGDPSAKNAPRWIKENMPPTPEASHP